MLKATDSQPKHLRQAAGLGQGRAKAALRRVFAAPQRLVIDYPATPPCCARAPSQADRPLLLIKNKDGSTDKNTQIKLWWVERKAEYMELLDLDDDQEEPGRR